jgi:hypothetical protein
MENKNPGTPEIKFYLILRQLKTLGIVIIISLTIIFVAGLFVTHAPGNVNKQVAILNPVSLFFCAILCFASLFIRRKSLKKLTLDNFSRKYFNIYVIAYALCELGGIFCVTTNLFVNQNFLYASAGYVVTVLYVFLNFPSARDFRLLNIKTEKHQPPPTETK